MSNVYNSALNLRTTTPIGTHQSQRLLSHINEGKVLVPNDDGGGGGGGGLQPPLPMVNGRPITTIRAVTGGSAGPVAISASHLNGNSMAGHANINLVPGSFSSTMPSRVQSASQIPITISNDDRELQAPPEVSASQLEAIKDKLAIERKVKEGAENLLQVLDTRKPKDAKKARVQTETELNAANIRIEVLESQLEILMSREREQRQARESNQINTQSKLSSKFRGEPLLPSLNGSLAVFAPGLDDGPLSTESPTFTVSDILNNMEEKGRRPEYYVELANALVHLLKKHPALKYELHWPHFGKRCQFMLCHEAREVVAAGYRVARYALHDLNSVRDMRALNTDIIVINSLAKEHLSSDARSNVEREQALKFVRTFLDVPHGVREISVGVLRAVVACGEQNDDRLRCMCLETLTEMLVMEPSSVVAAGGVRVLLQCLADGPFEISDTVVLSFLYLLDMPATRQYMRSGYDLEIIFSAFTDSHAKSHMHEEKLMTSAKVIGTILKSWPGVVCLSMYQLRSIRSLVESLKVPHNGVRGVILELLFGIFRIKSPSWSTSFLAGRRLTTYGRVANLKSEVFVSQPADDDDKMRINLVDHYTALLLSIFLEAGLMGSLVQTLAGNNDSALVRKTTLLIGEVLKLANKLLPNGTSAKLQLLPGLFDTASQFGDEGRFQASAAIYQIDTLNRTLQRSLVNGNSSQHRISLDEEKRNQRQVEQMKVKINSQLDESHFRNAIIETQILTTKNYNKWNWDLLFDLVQGPLLNAKRLEEAFRITKFMKRIMSFFRPFKYRFSIVKNTKPNQRYVRFGCALFHTLLQNLEGVKYLSENKVLRQVAECLAQLDPMSGISSPDPLFSKARLQDTLNGGYFTLLGTLSSDQAGLAMMDRWRMFNMFYHISELRSRDDLMFLFISAMDFTLEGHPRIILSKALTSGPKSVRLFATNHLRSLVEGCVVRSALKYNKTPTTPEMSRETSEWAIRLLVTQLYDPDVEVCETAVKILEEACNATSSLEFIVKCRPALDHLGEIGAPLLLRFLSTSVGYHYLNELDYITREMDDWFHGRNDAYVDHVEASLARAFADDDRPRKGVDGVLVHEVDNAGIVPPHFYRELARTREGCRLLEEKGHFEEFSLFIKEHGLEYEDPEIVVKVKGCLWAIGNIGSLPSGAPFLEEAETIGAIVDIAENSQVLSLKGTAFFVLGLVSRCVHGLEILDGYGWDCKTTEMGESTGHCIPRKLSQLLSLDVWAYGTGETNEAGRQTGTFVHDNDDAMFIKVVKAITNLSNHILANEASKELAKLKVTQPHIFQSQGLYKRVLALLESYRFRLPVRRFILELFDKKVAERMVKEGSGDGAATITNTSPTSGIQRVGTFEMLERSPV